MNAVTPQRSGRTVPFAYAERFSKLAQALPGRNLPWLERLREAAMARVEREGAPTPRVERWKYTNLNPLLQTEFVGPPPVEGLDRPGGAAITFVNGRLVARPALPDGLSLESLAVLLEREPEMLRDALSAEPEDELFRALNTALMTDGWVLRVEAGVALDEPLLIRSVARPGPVPFATHGRNLLLAGRGSRIAVIEEHVAEGSGAYWSQPVTDIRIGRDATVRHYRLQDEDSAAFHLAQTRAWVETGGRYDSFVLSTGARLARSEITVRLEQEGASCRLAGGYLGRGRQHLDTTTEILHAAPRTTSRQVYKGALDEQARGVFQGKISVARGAQKADGHQLNRTLLLSDRAEIDTKPELEIYADDVKCSHGAAAGELDDAALFYLRSRGLGLEEARRLLIEAFFGEVLEEVEDGAARRRFEERIGRWLAPGRAA